MILTVDFIICNSSPGFLDNLFANLNTSFSRLSGSQIFVKAPHFSKVFKYILFPVKSICLVLTGPITENVDTVGPVVGKRGRSISGSLKYKSSRLATNLKSDENESVTPVPIALP